VELIRPSASWIGPLGIAFTPTPLIHTRTLRSHTVVCVELQTYASSASLLNRQYTKYRNCGYNTLELK
jgi:hypothetical protein